MTTLAPSTTSIDRIVELLGDHADALLHHQCKTIDQSRAAPAGARLRRPRSSRRATARRRCCATSSACSTTAGSAGTGYVSILPVDQGIEHSAGASFAPNPIYFDPREHRQARDRGRLQRRRVDVRRARRRSSPQVRAQDPVHREDQPQRAADLSEQVRPDACSAASSRRGTWAPAASARRSTSARRSRAPDRRGHRGVRAAHELGHVHGALVLPAQQRLQERRRRLPRLRRPDRPGQPPRRHDRGRHHQAEAAREQRRLHGVSSEGQAASARRTSWSTRS